MLLPPLDGLENRIGPFVEFANSLDHRIVSRGVPTVPF